MTDTIVPPYARQANRPEVIDRTTPVDPNLAVMPGDGPRPLHQNQDVGGTNRPLQVPVIRYRASFKVVEISRTSLGIARITLSAQHDSGSNLMDSSSPKGNIVIETDPRFADLIQLGAQFFLVSA